MTKDWRHLHIQMVCLGFTEPRTSINYWPEHNEWQAWAVGIHRGAVKKAESLRGDGPMLVSAWLAMRASARGWDDLFKVWANKAHEAGELEEELIEGKLFKKLSRRLALEERAAISWSRFHGEYEETLGYPLRCSPLANAAEEEAIKWEEYSLE